jgi:uncharacterized protein
MAELPPRVSRRTLLRSVAGGALASPLLWTLYGEPRRMEVVRQEVAIPDLPVAFEGYRIGQISDLHFPRNITPSFIAKAVRRLRAEKPDLIVMTGDFFDGHAHSPVVPAAAHFLGELEAPDGVLACLGNHEIALNKRGAIRELKRAGMEMLVNEWTTITKGGESIRFAALDDLMYGQPDPVVAIPNGRAPTILLCHNPDYAEYHDPVRRVDLMLSGHTHGGEVVLPFVGATFVPSRFGRKYRAGLVAGPNCAVFVSKGVGSPRHFRWGAPPDVSLITLRRALPSP